MDVDPSIKAAARGRHAPYAAIEARFGNGAEAGFLFASASMRCTAAREAQQK